MNKPCRYYAQWSKPGTKNYMILPLWSSQIHRDRRNGGRQELGKKEWEWVLSVQEITVWKDEQSSADECSWNFHNNMNTLNATELCTES